MSASRRLVAADMFALVVFSFLVFGVIELISGYTMTQMLQSRIMIVPVNILIARPYGIFRDAIMGLGKAEQGGFIRITILDVIAFLLFQIPVYVALQLFNGVPVDVILTAVVGLIVALVPTARPYGLWMQFCRSRFTGQLVVTPAVAV